MSFNRSSPEPPKAVPSLLTAALIPSDRTQSIFTGPTLTLASSSCTVSLRVRESSSCICTALGASSFLPFPPVSRVRNC